MGQCLVDTALAGCERVIAEICGWIYRCVSGAELTALEQNGGFTDEASCVERFAAGGCSDATLGQAVRDGRQRLDPVRLNTCVGTLGALACIPLADFITHPRVATACEEVPLGLVLEGGSCTESNDCAGLEGYCGDTGLCEERGQSDYEIECSTAEVCPGGTCLTFVPNQQDLSGACTRRCSDDSDCGYQAVCATVNANDVCLSTCLDDDDCSAGLVCRVSAGHVVGVCSVVPL